MYYGTCEFALKFKQEIYERTRIESTIGIGPNLLLSKVALRLLKFNLYIIKKPILATFSD
nr:MULTISPECIES: hypothetical protein [Bacillus cereus group]